MYLSAPAKINIGLSIGEKMESGYHSLSSIFMPIGLYDIIEIVPSIEKTSLHVSGIPIEGDRKKNLIWKLITTLKQQEKLSPQDEWQIYLHKQIPVGAGLGGGSSDVIATMKLFEMLGVLHLNEQERRDLSRNMGSDCTFFLQAKPALVEGIGDCISSQTVSWNIDNWEVLLFFPEVFISTPWAYQQLDDYRKEKQNVFKYFSEESSPLFCLTHPPAEWREKVINHFEPAIFYHHPLLEVVKNIFYELGADYASMSGSGSTIFGLFPVSRQPNIRQVLQQLSTHNIRANSLQIRNIKMLN